MKTFKEFIKETDSAALKALLSRKGRLAGLKSKRKRFNVRSVSATIGVKG